MAKSCLHCRLVKFLMWNNTKPSMVDEIGAGFGSLIFPRALPKRSLVRIIQWTVVARSDC